MDANTLMNDRGSRQHMWATRRALRPYLHSVINCQARCHNSTLRIYVHADLQHKQSLSGLQDSVHVPVVQLLVSPCIDASKKWTYLCFRIF